MFQKPPPLAPLPVASAPASLPRCCLDLSLKTVLEFWPRVRQYKGFEAELMTTQSPSATSSGTGIAGSSGPGSEPTVVNDPHL